MRVTAGFLNKLADFKHWISWDAPTAPMRKTLQHAHYGILFYAKDAKRNKFYEIITIRDQEKGALQSDAFYDFYDDGTWELSVSWFIGENIIGLYIISGTYTVDESRYSMTVTEQGVDMTTVDSPIPKIVDKPLTRASLP